MRKRTSLALLGAVLVAVLVVGATTGCGSSSKQKLIVPKIFTKDTDAALALMTGKVDAYFADAPQVAYYVQKTGNKFEVVGPQLQAAPIGIATRKGDAVGVAIKQAIGKLYATGQMKTILTKWNLAAFALKGSEIPVAPAGSITPPANIKAAGQITFCSDLTYPPEESLQGNTPVGSDIDIAQAIADLMSVKMKVRNGTFDSIIGALLAKRCDAIISAMTDTPERAKKVNFADYLNVGMLLMVKKGNPEHIVANLAKLAGKTIAVEAGTTEKDALAAENKVLGKK